MKNLIKKISLILFGFAIIIFSSSSNAYADTNILKANDSSGNMTIDLVGSDYCVDLKGIMPGEHYYNNIIVKNNHTCPYDIYFKVSPRKDLSGKALELLKYINIEMKYGNKVIYKGPANGAKLKDITFVGTVYPDTKSKIDIYIDISKDLNKSFDDLESFNVFDFYSNINYSNDRSNKGNFMSMNSNGVNPKTGDNFKFYFYLISIIFCIVILILLNKKKVNNED